MIIVVEGLPGSGKTTTAKNIESYLKKRGYTVELFLENSKDNPIGFLWSKDIIPEAIRKTNLDEYPFGSWLNIPRQGKQITILESRLLQNTCYFCHLNDKEELAPLIPKKILQTLKKHCELYLVYLHQSNPKAHLEKIIKERKPLHPQWIPFVTEFHDQQPWLIKNNYRGEDGFLRSLLYWANLQKSIFNELNCSKIEIVDPCKDWDKSLKEIFQFIC